jgi:glycine cleavage system H protein
MIPEGLLFSKEHEWLRVEADNTASLGITDYAQEELGDITYVELPEMGSLFSTGESPVTIESVKAVTEVYTPVSCEVIEVNDQLDDEPELINNSPYEDGWIIKIKLTEPLSKPLMKPDEYEEYLDSLD